MNAMTDITARSGMFARSILSSCSIHPEVPVLHTLHLRYPRIIHAEGKTHRKFSIGIELFEEFTPTFDLMDDRNLSRNARSSRAVPVKTMLDEVRNAPFVPWHWGKNQKGMQAAEECNEKILIKNALFIDADTPVEREAAWLFARDQAADMAESFMNAGYHKQIANRLLEPFSWIDVLVTATDWSNFLWLRDHKDAEPHMRDLAVLVRDALETAEIQTLEPGQWHLPYITNEEFRDAYFGPSQSSEINKLLMISAARCARISYAPFDGDASYERELERYNQLVTSDRIHASPLEHQAKVYTGTLPQFHNDDEVSGLNGNFAPGWIQYRKTVPNEAVHG